MTSSSENRLDSWRATLRDALSGKHHDYTALPLNRAIILLAIPMVLETAMESLFAVCNIFWVAKLGNDATAAVGLTESVLTLYYALAIGLSMGATALVSRRIGEGDPTRAAQAGAQAIWVGLVVGLLSGIPCWLHAPKILAIMGATPEVVAQGSTYSRLVLGGNAAVLLLFLNNAIFRGAGDAALAMRALWLGNAINMALDPLLIYGLGPLPGLGLTGAGVATVIGRGSGVVYQMLRLHDHRSRITLTRSAWRFDPKTAGRLVRVSLGGVGQMIIATTSWVALMKIMAGFGSVVVSGYTIAIRVIVFTILPSWGLANAAATLVGQSLGAKMPERAERAVWLTGFFNMAFLGLIMVVFLVLGDPIVACFTRDPRVIAEGGRFLRAISYGYLFFGWGLVLSQAFNGAGDTVTPTWMNFLAFWVLQIPLAWLLAKHFGYGPPGVVWAIVAADAAFTLLALPVFRLGRWKTRAV